MPSSNRLFSSKICSHYVLIILKVGAKMQKEIMAMLYVYRVAPSLMSNFNWKMKMVWKINWYETKYSVDLHATFIESCQYLCPLYFIETRIVCSPSKRKQTGKFHFLVLVNVPEHWMQHRISTRISFFFLLSA